MFQLDTLENDRSTSELLPPAWDKRQVSWIWIIKILEVDYMNYQLISDWVDTLAIQFCGFQGLDWWYRTIEILAALAWFSLNAVIILSSSGVNCCPAPDWCPVGVSSVGLTLLLISKLRNTRRTERKIGRNADARCIAKPKNTEIPNNSGPEERMLRTNLREQRSARKWVSL